MLARGLVFSKDYNTQGSFKARLNTIASLKTSPATPIQPRKVIIERAKTLSKLQHPKSLIILC